MVAQEITYLDTLKVSWLLIWRGALIGSVVGFVFGAIAAFVESHLGISEEGGRAIIAVGSFLISIGLVGPLLIRMLLRKRFQGFRLEIVREPLK